ncbi:GNAT family N-acetyltransferase [Actinoplanes sp. TFC3]|uniref:GNAT family N-acetyltransferase n=1 Tax=Actinoplanes sp. TFC3 TaxID=1710355 RepID=UPI000AACB5FC|nr:GNAT family N-acetyltransferase [Actinoplanes sp. TFC3]
MTSALPPDLTLPPGLTLRRPTLDEAPHLLALAHANDIVALGAPEWTAEEINEALSTPNTELDRDCWVVADADGLVGWAFLQNVDRGDRDRLEVLGWPGRGDAALRPLLELLLARAAERGAAFGHEVYTLRAGAIPSEKLWIETLTDAGFAFVKQHARMTMALTGVPHTAPEPPAGVTIRAVRAEDNAEMRRFHATIVETFRDTDHHTRDYASWRARLEAEASISYDEWFVAFVDGEWAGVLESSDFGATHGTAWVRVLGVLRTYRKRGVGQALLRRAFATYAAKGRTEVGLGVDMANPTQAARLYRAVGMHPKFEANIYQRELRL